MKKIILLLIILFCIHLDAQINITSGDFNYKQDFNSLSNTGTSNTWTDNQTILGWYSNRMIYRTDYGASNTGALYSYGNADSTERALGSVASGSTSTIYYAVRFVNNSSEKITQVSINFIGEQWRNGGNTSQQTLEFAYKIGAIDSLADLNFIPRNEFDFISPIVGSTATALNGNAIENQSIINSTLSISLNVGEEIWFRWKDINDSGSDHGLAIDNFDITFTGEVSTTATKLSITSINQGVSPFVNIPFDVIIKSFDNENNLANVTQNTIIKLSLNTGNGLLEGNLIDTIMAGSDSVVISGVKYNMAETGVQIKAEAISGDNLDFALSSLFNVLEILADHLAFVDFPDSGIVNQIISPFKVEARKSDNTIDTTYVGNLAISKETGEGNISGTLIKNAIKGIALFDDIKFDKSGIYKINANAEGLTSATSSEIFIGEKIPLPNNLNAWINEIHYDNVGSDSSEFIEVAIQNPDSFDLNDFSIVLYNGNSGTSYGTHSLNTFIEGYSDTNDNVTLYYKFISGIQNGGTNASEPDGLVLVYKDLIVQFLSYEGIFTAIDVPANGMTSTDIGVKEDPSPTVGSSLSLVGKGNKYEDFFWQLVNYVENVSFATPGELNYHQSIDTASVQYEYFVVNPDSNSIEVKWKTLKEINNAGFYIERNALSSGNGWWAITFIQSKPISDTSNEYYYDDVDVNDSIGKYQYRLKQIDNDSTFSYTNEIEVMFDGIVDVNDNDNYLPKEFSLSQNYPNPFNPSTKIKYTITASPKSSPKERTFVRLIVYDILGNEIATLVNEEKSAGTYEVEFNGKGLSSGMYFYKLETGNFVEVKKMILLK
ncbi:MAG: hypothetical protein STSR0008_05100 [Ignavibacterium sp.]